MLYIIGVVKSQRLQSLNMVYGSEYCASEETYSNIRNRIKESVLSSTYKCNFLGADNKQ